MNETNDFTFAEKQQALEEAWELVRFTNIKERHEEANVKYHNNEFSEMKIILEQLFLEEDTDWLIEQAERSRELKVKVESLQVENGGLRELHERLEGMWLYEKRCLHEENDRLREALIIIKDEEEQNLEGYESTVYKLAREALEQSQ